MGHQILSILQQNHKGLVVRNKVMQNPKLIRWKASMMSASSTVLVPSYADGVALSTSIAKGDYFAPVQSCMLHTTWTIQCLVSLAKCCAFYRRNQCKSCMGILLFLSGGMAEWAHCWLLAQGVPMVRFIRQLMGLPTFENGKPKGLKGCYIGGESRQMLKF